MSRQLELFGGAVDTEPGAVLVGIDLWCAGRV